MNIRIIAVVSILMSFLANYVMYIFNCAFTNWLFHPYEYFLASLDIWNFFLFKIIYLNLRITTLQYTDGTRTSLKVTEDQDSRTGHKSHSWLKRARSVKEEETIFTGVCERLDKYHPDLCVVIELWFRGAVPVAQDEQERLNWENQTYMSSIVYVCQVCLVLKRCKSCNLSAPCWAELEL